jgi:hypothetical protein
VTRDEELERFWKPYAALRKFVEQAPDYQGAMKRGDYDKAEAIAIDYIETKPPKEGESKEAKRHRQARADFMEDRWLEDLVIPGSGVCLAVPCRQCRGR